MTERKPANLPFESWIDRQIRSAQERGEFDDLPGRGKPLPGHGGRYDENWWVSDLLRREDGAGAAALPPALKLRKEIDDLPGVLAGLRTEQRVRAVIGDLNARILQWQRTGSGPRLPVMPVDEQAAVQRWRAEQAEPAEPAAEPGPVVTGQPAPRRRWWRRNRP